MAKRSPGATAGPSFIKLLKQKQGFLTAVYLTLVVQLVITFAIVYKFREHPTLSKATKQSFFVYLFLTIGIILLLTMFNFPPWVRMLLFTVFSVVIGGMLHNASAKVPAALVTQALSGAIGIFLGMTVFAFVLAGLGVDLAWMGIVLFAGLIGLLIAYIIMWLADKRRDPETKKMTPLYRTILTIGLALFAIYIIYETNIMLQKNYNQDFISAAIDLYLDFVNVFSHLLALESD